jgi:hypothetical protein
MFISKRHIELIKSWVSARTHRERVGILLLGWAAIYILWYLIIEKPLNQSRLATQHQTEAMRKQAAFFDNESNNVLNEAAKSAKDKQRSLEQQKQFESLNIQFASPLGNDTLLKAILTPFNKIKFISLTKTPENAAPTAQGVVTIAATTAKPATVNQDDKGIYQLIFHSDYLDTLSYLEQLEKLPWCLSWDSLEYKTLEYPDAEVTVNLHIVSA